MERAETWHEQGCSRHSRQHMYEALKAHGVRAHVQQSSRLGTEELFLFTLLQLSLYPYLQIQVLGYG